MKSSAEPHGAADVELLKAVAQAWHAQSGNPRHRPLRFKLEAAAAAAAPSRRRPWDFSQSLWDTYELVAVAQNLESSLVITDQAAPRAVAGEGATRGGGGKRARESSRSRSLRCLFLRSSSRRFEESSS